MPNMLFANNANTTLASSLTNVATTMSVTSATGFPSPTGSQYFYCTLADAATQTTIEIVKVTAVSGTTFTIVRGQDGTTGTIFASGAVVSLRLVAASLNDFSKLDEANSFIADQTINTLTVGKGGGNQGTNTVLGNAALGVNSSGVQNTIIGYNAGYTNSSGSQCTALGYYSLNQNTTGTYNTAVGMSSLQSNSSGGNNSAFGYSALANNQTGYYNTAVGMSSLNSNTNSYNTAVGYTALYQTNSGANNTAIGYAAGYAGSANANTTGSNNTYLGYNTVGSAVGNSNETVIGASAIGNGSNTMTFGNNSVTANYFNGSITGTQHLVSSAILTSTTQGSMAVGTLSYSDTGHLATYQASTNNYIQTEIQNTNAGAAASSDHIVGNNNTTATTYYGDFGMNSSGWAGVAGTASFNAPNMVYLTSTTADLAIGTTTANIVRFSINGGADIAQITSTGLNSAPIGATTASTGAFTTLSASSTVSGTGFSTYLASPPAIGGTAAAAGTFTALTATGTTTLATSLTGLLKATSGVVSAATAGTDYVAVGGALGTPSSGTVTNLTGTASININGTVGATTPASGSFTSLTATSVGTAGVLAKNGGKTAVTAVSATTTLTTGGTTLASQTMASGSTWRVVAYGTFAAANSGTSRTFTMACFWGSTQLTAITTGSVLTSTAQTTPWKVEFEITGSSATAAWVTGFLSAQVTSATIPLNYAATAASTTGLTTTSTLDFRVANGTSAVDAINVQQVTIERIV